MLKYQTKIKEYFCRGRHNNVNEFYLCQSIHKISKQCIRQNANMFILFFQDVKTLKYFHETRMIDQVINLYTENKRNYLNLLQMYKKKHQKVYKTN